MKKLILVLCLMLNMSIAAAQVSYQDPESSYYITTEYEVQENDTLDSIAKLFITPERDLREFREGIVELNYDKVFKVREKSGEGDVVHKGDIIKVNHRKEF